MIYKLKHGDTFKVLPIVMKDNTFSSHIVVLSGYFFNRIIYDTSSGYLANFFRENFSNSEIQKFRIIRNFFCIYINGKVEFICVGRYLTEFIRNSILDIRDNKQLCVSIIDRSMGSGQYSDYSKSIFIERDWVKPVKNINSQLEWIDWIKNNQQGYIEEYIEKLNIINNIDIFKDKGLPFTNLISEIISEERNKKLDKILTKDNFLNI